MYLNLILIKLNLNVLYWWIHLKKDYYKKKFFDKILSLKQKKNF